MADYYPIPTNSFYPGSVSSIAVPSSRMHPVFSGMIGVIIALGLTAVILWFASSGRIRYMFTSDSMACGATKEMQKRTTGIPNVTSLYVDGGNAGANLHNCGNPSAYRWGGLTYTLNPTTGKYVSDV